MITIKLLICKTSLMKMGFFLELLWEVCMLLAGSPIMEKKCKRVALVPYDVGHVTFLPKFGKIETVFLIHGFMYFKVFLNYTFKLNDMLQSY